MAEELEGRQEDAPNSDIEEEEEYPTSEDEYTSTDVDDEVTSYWEGLKEGVLSHPASLQLQCILYIIGHIKFEPPYQSAVSTGSVSYLPASCMGLLPCFIRIRLLCLLPAVDVAKLEGTPVTIGISMDEIWEYIFNERLPLHDKKLIRRDDIVGINTVEELMSKGIESVTWKDAYFNSVILLSQICYEDRYYECEHDHFIPDLYYGMGTFNSDPSNTDIYQCFNTDSTYSIHGVVRCTHKCPRLTPDRYTSMYPCPADVLESKFHMSLFDAIKVMADCNVTLKHLHITNYLSENNHNSKSTYFLDYLKKLLTSVEAITIDSRDENEFIMKIFDIIFVQNKCSIKFVSLCDLEFEIAIPYLLQCNLKQFELNIEFDDYNSYTVDRKISSHSGPSSQLIGSKSLILTNYYSFYPPAQELSDSISHSIIEVLQYHQGLEKLLFNIAYYNKNVQLVDSQLTQCISNLLSRPAFKELSFFTESFGVGKSQVSFHVFLQLLRNFFSSPNPVTLSLNLNCPDIPLYTDSLIDVNHEQEANKSLDLTNCTLSPNLSSLLPRNLVLGSLKISPSPYSIDVLSSFASLDSITVKSFSIENVHFTKGASSSISSLFRIVHAQEWNIIITNVDDDVFDFFISLLSNKAHLLRHFDLQNDPVSTPNLIFIIQTIFSSLSPADVPHFELSLNCRLLNDDVTKDLYDLWEKHCNAIKIKKINVLPYKAGYGRPSYVSTLLDMASKVI